MLNARWSAVVISSRESYTILSLSIKAVLVALADVPAILDVIVNGNSILCNEIKYFVRSLYQSVASDKLVRLWYIPISDKANALNAYLYQICPFTEIVYFVDGYVQPKPDSFNQLGKSLDSTPSALGVTGIPSMGASAKKMHEEIKRTKGLHGNLFAVRGSVLKRLNEMDCRLPVGLYCTDGLIGACLKFNLDPANYAWDNTRICVCESATWELSELSLWRLGDINRYCKRVVRQLRGRIENRALSYYLTEKKVSLGELPRSIREIVFAWVKADPLETIKFFIQKPFCMIGAIQFIFSKDRNQIFSAPLSLIEEAKLYK